MCDLWTWSLADRPDPAAVRGAVAAATGRAVAPLGAAADGDAQDAILCDVWHTGGEFPTVVDCYLAPTGVSELAVAASVAVRLGRACLLADESLDPTRHLLVAADGTVRRVHATVTEAPDGPHTSDVRPCTADDPWCGRGPGRRPAPPAVAA